MPVKRPENLQARHTLFAQEFAAHRNGAKAAIAAGYAAGSAHVKGSQLLSRPNVQALVAKFDADLTERTTVTKEWVVNQTIHTYGKALELDQVAAARSCLHLLSLLHGYIVERKDLRIITSIKDLSQEELESIASTVIEGDPVNSIEPGGGEVTLPPDLVEELRAFARLMAERSGNAAWCDPLGWQWRRVAEALDRCWHADAQVMPAGALEK